MSTVTAEPLRRDVDAGIVAGVCAGVAAAAAASTRSSCASSFGAATLAGGAGLVVYLLAWALVPARGRALARGARLAGTVTPG